MIYIKRKVVLIASIITIIVVIIPITALKFVSKPADQALQKNLVSETIPTTALPGHLIYQDVNGEIVKFNFANQQKDIILPKKLFWNYKNKFLFAVNDDNTISRLSLTNKSEVKIRYDYPSAITEIYPSPDGSKAIVIVVEEAPLSSRPILYIYDFENKTTKELFRDKDIRQVTWFANSEFVVFSTLSIINYFKSNIETKILDTRTFASKKIDISWPYSTSMQGDYIISAGDMPNPYKNHDLFAKTFPTLVFQSLSHYFPETKEVNKRIFNSVIPFNKFPVIARDYKEIEQIIPGKEYDFFFLQINADTPNIYFTDSGGTFKKITPNNSDSYKLLSYNSYSHKILAIRYHFDASKNIIDRSSLVLLDPENYSETVSGIYDKNFTEIELLKLPGDQIYYLTGDTVLFSPNGDYVLVPLNIEPVGVPPARVAIISVKDKSTTELDLNFSKYLGSNFRFFWVE